MVMQVLRYRRPPVAFLVPGTGGIFRNPADAMAYANTLASQGRMSSGVQRVTRPGIWYDSLDEFSRLANMPSVEFEELFARWRDSQE